MGSYIILMDHQIYLNKSPREVPFSIIDFIRRALAYDPNKGAIKRGPQWSRENSTISHRRLFTSDTALQEACDGGFGCCEKAK